MIWKVHGKTFSKICQERYAYVSNVTQRRLLSRAGQQDRADSLTVRYIAGYSDIPNKELRTFPYSLLQQRVKMLIMTVLFMIHMIFSINL